MTINSNEDLISEAIQNVSKAHQMAARTDMQAMATAGQVSRVVSQSLDNADKQLAINEYYKNKAIASNAITRLAEKSVNSRTEYSYATSLDDLNKAHEDFNNVTDGLLEQAKKSNLPQSIQEEIAQKANYYREQNTLAFNHKTGSLSADMQYNNFMQSVGAVSLSVGGKLPDVSNLVPTAHLLLDNPYLNQTQREHVSHALININAIRVEDSNPSLQSDADKNTNMSISRANSITGTNNLIKGLFLDHKSLLGASNLNLATIKPAQFKEMRENFNELNNLYTDVSTSHNVPGMLAELNNSDRLGSQVSAQLSKLLQNNQGDVLIRGLSQKVNNDYQAYLQASDNDKSVTWHNYQTSLKEFAQNSGIPMAKVNTLPQNFIDTMGELDKNYSDPNYPYLKMSELNHFNELNGDNPIGGVGHISNTARLYKYGKTGNPDFAPFIANTNTNRQNEISKEFNNVSEAGQKEDIKGYLSDKSKAIEQIASITDSPIVTVQNAFKTTLEEFMLHGSDFDDAINRTNQIMQGYVNTEKMDVGNNFTLPRGTFAELGIANDDKDEATHYAIALALEGYVRNDKAKPAGVPLEAWRTNRRDQVGSPSDYSMIYSNGNYYAKNNVNGNLLPMNKGMLEAGNLQATDHSFLDTLKDTVRNFNFWEPFVDIGRKIGESL